RRPGHPGRRDRLGTAARGVRGRHRHGLGPRAAHRLRMLRRRRAARRRPGPPVRAGDRPRPRPARGRGVPRRPAADPVLSRQAADGYGGTVTKRVQHKQAARAVREQLAAERRRARTMWISIIAVAVLIIGGLVGYGIYQSNRPKDTTVPAGAVDGRHRIATGTGPAKVEIYLDFICPACGKFERENGAKLTQQVTDNKITLVTHPVNFLDDASKGTKYSTRAGSASGCASNGGKFSEFTAAMFAGQPKDKT